MSFRAPARHRAALTAVGVALLLLSAAAAPVAAKVFVEARLAAPISFQTPPGSDVLVTLFVTVPDGIEDVALDDAPVVLRLTGPGGATTEATAAASADGRYTLRITVPPGGPRRLEIQVGGPDAVPVFLMEDPFTFRPVGPGTAQLAVPATAPASPDLPVELALLAVVGGLVIATGALLAVRRARRAGPEPSPAVARVGGQPPTRASGA